MYTHPLWRTSRFGRLAAIDLGTSSVLPTAGLDLSEVFLRHARNIVTIKARGIEPMAKHGGVEGCYSVDNVGKKVVDDLVSSESLRDLVLITSMGD
jgi:hypothetical protein